jgi:peptidoglycan/xylan/chitin deacetylase (PgdA/CDA1 family)
MLTERPGRWPGGARCAVSLTFDCDADSLLHVALGARARTALSALTWLQYDEIGVPRIVEMLGRLGLRQTFFVPAWCLDRYPAVFEQVVSSGHEIAAHGFLHESPSSQTPTGEEYWLERSADVIESFTGQRPRGFRAPWCDLSDRTINLLATHGFVYDSSLQNDDLPYILRSAEGDIVELPTDLTIDDWSQYAHVYALDFLMQPKAPTDAIAVWQAEFDAAYEMGGMFVAVLHPFVSGRPARARALETFVEYIASRDGIWIAPMEEIASHCRQRSADGAELARLREWPPYATDVLRDLNRTVDSPDACMLQKTAHGSEHADQRLQDADREPRGVKPLTGSSLP